MTEQATYPNSGPTDARKNVAGQGISNATEMSDSKSQSSSGTVKQEQEETTVIQTGPYKDGVYQFKKNED